MSINQYSTSDLSQPPQWWSPPPIHKSTFCHPIPMATFDLNNQDEEDYRHTPEESGHEEEPEIPKERLFEKALTPSDVGKLNRLVIPKQHAERHFPLNGASTAAEPGENGLLLGFEDENGKSWRFRYSYWNSSQSYVLTKGWSRFVKEKRLDAGDVVVFARHRVDTGRFFIGWRRRASGADSEASRPAAGGGGGWNHMFNNPGQQLYPYPSPYQQASSSLSYQPEFIPAETVVQEKKTTGGGGGGSGNSKWLRLFGVNLECHQAADESDSSTPVGSPMSSHHGQGYYYSNNHMDISLSGGGRGGGGDDDIYHRQG